MISLVPKALAFSSVEALKRRSLMVGLSILALALGLSLLLVKNLTRGLQELWRATLRVSVGDFTSRVKVGGVFRDEASELAQSFNTMSAKIEGLMLETAEKARMEKELETAEEAQKRLFPQKNFEHPRFSLSGTYLPASKCAGDWWHYAQLGDKLLVVVGDVTGHGVSTALVTAAAHGAFTVLMKQFESGLLGELRIDVLLRYLNSSVLATTRLESNMTFIASIVDLTHLTVTTANASHPPAFVFRRDSAVASASRVETLKSKILPPLGDSPDLPEIEVTQIQLKPGDSLLWYTDGLFERRLRDGYRLKKLDFIEQITAHVRNAESAEMIRDTGIRFVLGPPSQGKTPELADDITLVVGVVGAG